MLRKKIERILQGADIDYSYSSGLLEFHLDGFYHFIKFECSKEAVLIKKEPGHNQLWDLNDDTYEDILNAIL